MSDVKWAGPEALRPLLVPVGEISTHPDNPRRGDIERIAESLLRFGQMRPAAVQSSTGYIAAGNHTYRAATEILGWTHFAVAKADISDEETIAYVIADNRTADLGEYDDAAHAAILAKLLDDGKLAGTGYTPDEADDELARLRALADTPMEEFHGGHSESPEQLAAREAARAAAPIMREIVLMYDPERYLQFGGWVKILSKEYGTTGTIETVFAAVERAARAESGGAE
jgi:ParB/Sulfiredoxin domain